MSDENEVSHWISQVKQADSQAQRELWHHYYDQLIRRVRRHLHGRQSGLADEEDIVVSVFESFYRAAQGGRFPELADRDDLWRLLLRMSARKVVDKRRHDGRQRRGADERIVSLQGGQDGEELEAIQVIGDQPTPEMVASMAESFEKLISRLGGGQLREIAVGKMEGYSNAELAERLHCSERTIERRLHLIRETCLQEMIEPE